MLRTLGNLSLYIFDQLEMYVVFHNIIFILNHWYATKNVATLLSFETKIKLKAGTRNRINFILCFFSGALVSTLKYTFPSKGGGGMSLHIDRLAAVNKEKDEFRLYRIKTSNLHPTY